MITPYSIENKGFTFMEVLMAIAIFAVGFMAVSTLQMRFTNDNTNARRTIYAGEWATDRIEDLMAMPFSDPMDTVGFTQLPALDPGNNGDRDPVTSDSGDYTMNWDVTDVDLDGNAGNGPELKVIDLRVFWKVRGIPKRVDFRFAKARNF